MFALGAAITVAGWLVPLPLPDPGQIVHSSRQEPRQTATSVKPFEVVAEKIRYTVEPVADYEISGVVVSRHDTNVFWNYIHDVWQDHLNIADLCIVWGKNLATDNYKKLKYSSGQFVCNIEARDRATWQVFEPSAISNNHILTNNKSLEKKLLSVKIGDQISIRGYLANYRHNEGNGFSRGTSTVRDDQGNGACETVFVKDAVILRRAPQWHSWLKKMGAILLLMSAICWFWVTPLQVE